MNNTGRATLIFLTGLGIGAGLASLFAPQSGEETREWIADTAERRFKGLRRMGRRSLRQLQGAVADGEEKITEVLRNARKLLNQWPPSWISEGCSIPNYPVAGSS